MKEILASVTESLKTVDTKTIDKVIEILNSAKRIFVVGMGRSGLAAKSFAHRIVDLGYEVFVAGETIMPRAKPGDVVVAVSGSGNTTYTLNVVEIAKDIGAKIISITSYPESQIGKLSDIVVVISGRENATPTNKKDYLSRQITGIHEPLTPKGAAFEISALIFLESLVIKINQLKCKQMSRSS